jgi:hypothetical protein
MRMTTKSGNTFTNKHLSIIIAWIIIIALAFSLQNIESVEAGNIPGPYNLYGYIDQWNGTDVPSGVTVTATCTNNSTTGTTTTGAQGAFVINVGASPGMGCSYNDQIVINCSYVPGSPYNDQTGENATLLDSTKPWAWCNLTGGTKMENVSLSINVSPWEWDAGTIAYNDSNATSTSYFNLTNQGNVIVNIKIHGENISFNGDTWYVNSTTGVNGFTAGYQNSTGGGWTNISYSNASFVTDLEHDSDYFSYTHWHLFGLNLSMPWENSDKPSGSQTFNVTLWAIKAYG